MHSISRFHRQESIKVHYFLWFPCQIRFNLKLIKAGILCHIISSLGNTQCMEVLFADLQSMFFHETYYESEKITA